MNNITVLFYFAWHKYRSDYFYIYLRDNLKNVNKNIIVLTGSM